MSSFQQSPKWVDVSEYPFENKYIQLTNGKMHYVDEGTGKVILFVHGTPTWSFLYREYIATLSLKYRCIAIDHLGFGLSEKPLHFDGKPRSHAQNLTEFIELLELDEITLVVHDFGGPIGLSSAIQHPDRIKQVVLFNTWLWETKNNPAAEKTDRIIRSRMGRFLYLNLNFSPKYLLKKGFYDQKKLSKAIHKQYILPFPNKSSRISLLNMGKSLVGSSDWFQEQWENLDKLEHKPSLILWGTKDPFIPISHLKKWRDRLPHAEVRELDCGHFVPEEKATETLFEIENWLQKNK